MKSYVPAHIADGMNALSMIAARLIVLSIQG